MDRREKEVVDSVRVTAGGRFERIETPHKDERVYLWTKKEGSNNHEMFWMQTKSEDGEDEIVAQVNQFLTNPSDAAPEGEAPAAPASSGANVDSPSNQVDALSNILENLGMPPETPSSSSGAATTGATSTAAAAAAAGPGGTLTLADLQGAMAGLATNTASAGPRAAPLSEVDTPSSITSLLEDEAAKNRLLELLPENQRSVEHLEENLRSPQIQQTLRTLTQALVPDETGSLEGYNSVIANFQLDAKDGEEAITKGNPIQAFLDCIVASVEKEDKKDGETAAEKDDAKKEGEDGKKDDEAKDGDAMEE